MEREIEQISSYKLLNYSKITIPLVVGGLVGFFIVYNFYPEKHENIRIDGGCYELTGTAHRSFINLTSSIEKSSLLLQLSKVEDPNASIPISFTGEHIAINNFIDKHLIGVTSAKNVTLYPNMAGNIVNGNISLRSLSSIVENLSLYDISAASKSLEGSISIIPSEHITDQEIKNISGLEKTLLQNGLRNIVATHEGVSPAECRYR
ncbi:hypothetical protein H7X64_00585 [Armatimonadetes bacterium]|nr:hypothetical protein [bacterium]